LASSTKKREGKATSSLGLLLDLIIGFIIIFTIIIGVAVPSPWVSYSRRRKIGIDKRLRVLQFQVGAHFVFSLLHTRQHVTHLLMRLMNDDVIGLTHGDKSLEALDEDVSMLVSMSGSSRCLWSIR
jgi:hypothetical protein